MTIFHKKENTLYMWNKIENSLRGKETDTAQPAPNINKSELNRKISRINIITTFVTGIFIGLASLSLLAAPRVLPSSVVLLLDRLSHFNTAIRFGMRISLIAIPILLFCFLGSFLGSSASTLLIHKKYGKDLKNIFRKNYYPYEVNDKIESDTRKFLIINFIFSILATNIGAILGGATGIGFYFIPIKNIYFKITAISLPILIGASLGSICGNFCIKKLYNQQIWKRVRV
ncbi:MAG: hypothetical protein AMS24_00555 [Chlamydiae bacterium SM23_39]|nr:MAG: hypothetical protein AMS24_00555 [Chlamydiae bacterium SM23_39]